MSPRRRLLLLAALLAVGLLLAVGWWGAGTRAPARAARPGPKPNVVMVVVDTLRADRLGAYGNQRGLTPFLDSLAARGTLFARAYANSSWTCPSVASLFTSRYPTQHHVVGFASSLAPSERTLAEALADAGYRNGGFTANFRLTPELGYAQGFTYWGAYVPNVTQGEAAAKIRGGRLREEAESWILGSRILPAKQPFFLYFQLMETHAPYEPPAPFRARFAPPGEIDDAAAMQKLLQPAIGLKGLAGPQLGRMLQLYDGEVASADEELRQLFERLTALGVLTDDSVIIVTADHGEEFGEHGQLLHGITLYEPAIRVPLLVIGPDVVAGQIVTEPVALLDLAPTLLDLLGLPAEASFEGTSLAPRLRGEAEAPHPLGVVSELERVNPKGIEMRMHGRALTQGANKTLLTPHGGLEVYDLGSDPGERVPLAGDRAVQVAGAIAPLAAQHAALAARAAEAGHESAVLDDATKEKLRALGYHD
ncbi:MAG: sulfatase [Deltaproteobacteria bacterium]|nr:sulfatase [Deltaproteobacteria bacterium]